MRTTKAQAFADATGNMKAYRTALSKLQFRNTHTSEKDPPNGINVNIQQLDQYNLPNLKEAKLVLTSIFYNYKINKKDYRNQYDPERAKHLDKQVKTAVEDFTTLSKYMQNDDILEAQKLLQDMRTTKAPAFANATGKTKTYNTALKKLQFIKKDEGTKDVQRAESSEQYQPSLHPENVWFAQEQE